MGRSVPETFTPGVDNVVVEIEGDQLSMMVEITVDAKAFFRYRRPQISRHQKCASKITMG